MWDMPKHVPRRLLVPLVQEQQLEQLSALSQRVQLCIATSHAPVWLSIQGLAKTLLIIESQLEPIQSSENTNNNAGMDVARKLFNQ